MGGYFGFLWYLFMVVEGMMVMVVVFIVVMLELFVLFIGILIKVL